MQKNIFKHISIITVFTGSLFLILNFILAGEFWLWNIFSVIPPIFFLLISIFIFFMSLNRLAQDQNKVIWAFLLVLASIALLTVAFRSGLNLKAVTLDYENIDTTGAVSIFNFNTRYWAEDEDSVDRLLEHIRNQNADIYTIQEHLTFENAPVGDDERVKAEFSDYESAFAGEFITFSRYPIVKQELVRNSFLRTDIDINSEIVSVYNVHIPVQFFASQPADTRTRGFFEDLEFRYNWRKTEFKALESELRENPNQKIVSGDFNATVSMGSMSGLLGEFNDSQSYSNNIYPATWEFVDMRLWQIDYVLFDEEIEIIKHEDVDSKGFSDHWGQRVWFEV